mmetsp:Transcript_4397/g.9606  ORF Transcript_4397/g.9606 Transcript_4397/m.9606 type:complete len:224 (+) Transcript_4397:318-989(+)
MIAPLANFLPAGIDCGLLFCPAVGDFCIFAHLCFVLRLQILSKHCLTNICTSVISQAAAFESCGHEVLCFRHAHIQPALLLIKDIQGSCLCSSSCSCSSSSFSSSSSCSCSPSLSSSSSSSYSAVLFSSLFSNLSLDLGFDFFDFFNFFYLSNMPCSHMPYSYCRLWCQPFPSSSFYLLYLFLSRPYTLTLHTCALGFIIRLSPPKHFWVPHLPLFWNGFSLQ